MTFFPAGRASTSMPVFSGSVGSVSYNSSTHLFSVTVTAGSDHNAVIALH